MRKSGYSIVRSVHVISFGDVSVSHTRFSRDKMKYNSHPTTNDTFTLQTGLSISSIPLHFPSSTTLAVANFNWGGFLSRKPEPPKDTTPAPLDAICSAKTQAFDRGAMTAATLVAFLKKYSTEKKGQTLDQLVASAAVAVPNQSRRAMLLQTYDSLSTSTQKRSMNKFSSSSAVASFSSSSSSSKAGGAILGGKYSLLSTGSQGPRVSSGKSAVVDAIAVNKSPKSILKAKLSRNVVALRREADNLKALRGVGAGARKSVIEVFDFLENYDGRGSHALIMEAGKEDLVGRVKRGGALSRKDLKKACAVVVEVLGALEKKQLVWTDLRASNFVVMPAKGLGDGQIKAIDLESAVPVGERPVDCTPEVTPPEVARLYVQGRLTEAVAVTSYDVWSLGILLLFLASGGKNLFDGEASSRVMASLASATQEKVEGQVEKLVSDVKIATFIKTLLVVDPRQRLGVAAIKAKLFFF